MFAAPSPDIIYEAAKAVHRGKGVLFLYGNYAGDNMNFDMAAEMLEEDGIDVRTVRVTDDVAAAPPERTHDRRGIAGDLYMIKIAGGASSELQTLDEVERVARKAVANIRSIGVAVSAGSIPETGKLTFELADDEIEIGMGAHGEAGVSRQKIAPADDRRRPADGEDPRRPAFQARRRGRADDQQSRRDHHDGDADRQSPHPRRSWTAKASRFTAPMSGTWLTVQEMAGFSVTLLKLDDELKRYLDMPAESLGYSRM